jgi:recombinational DNA repair protein (RecF pathway)
MNITKCDICHKTIEDGNEVSVGYLSPLPRNSFCLKCAKPVVAFLQKNNLIEKD